MGIVPQDALLFNKTIYENIVMNSKISMEDVQKVAEITCIDEEIKAMPMGYNTISQVDKDREYYWSDR
jgi:ABC-type bacteriocin/lantibiotic exporter with double-glycine peptidase domain